MNTKHQNWVAKAFRLAVGCALWVMPLQAQQLPNAGFEDWSGATFDGNAQPASWNASNVTQFGFKFNFAHKEAGHTGNASMMVQDQSVGAAGITETSPGYFSLGQPWVYVKSLTSVSEASAGTEGGVSWTYRPDTMSVWIRRTGSNVAKEDFYLLYYAWSGTANGSKYKGKNGSCTNTSRTNEESDIRQALDGNECGTDQKVTQIAEGMWREKKEYNDWVNIRVPIFYFNNEVPTMMNIIFSASNYPNFRANSGLYAGNSLYVDDVELIYSANIQKIYIDDKEWKGFDPNSSDEQTYSLGRNATALPKIEARRGAGELTNARGTTATFAGRVLSGSEITITDGVIDGTPTVITVKSEDGKTQKTYKIKFVREPSKNTKLASIRINGEALSNFTPATYTYNVALPYGTTATPVVSVEGQEDEQSIQITQPTSTTGKATIKVTAADKTTTSTYTLNFSVALLADNTLQNILVNGKGITGYTPTQTIYRVSLPTSTTTMPTVQAVSAYPDGAQTITYTAPSQIDGGSYLVSVTTPGNQVPKTYKLNFKLEKSSYSYLADLQVEGGYLQDFDPMTYTYYINLPMGTTAVPAITYTKGEDEQTVEITDGGIDGTTRVTVTAASGDYTVYKIVCSTPKSEICTLSGIRIGGVELSDFSADKTEYTYVLPIGTTELPAIEPVKGDEFETVTVLTGGVDGQTRITVMAGNGNTSVYTINFSVEQATNATLKMIYLDGEALTGYQPSQLEYTIQLPKGTTRQPVVTYTPNDAYQTITARAGSGVEDDYKITVRPQSGAGQTYILHFSVETSANTDLSMIYVGGEALEGFSADKADYTYTLPVGVSTIPAVTYDKAEAVQKVLSMCENNVQRITVTAESGAKKTYTIVFIIQKSENAFLDMIYLNGVALEGFEKQTLTYTVPLTGSTCPAITVDKEDGQQVTITAPYKAGTASIRVTPETGAANTYTLTFVAQTSTQVQLLGIAVDGVALADFSRTTPEYTLTYTGTLPEVSYTADEGQTVQVLRNGQDVTLYVEKNEETTSYTLHFVQQPSTDCALSAILLDGVEMADFVPATTDYTVSLPAGSALPALTYRKGAASQTVFFGQTDRNQSAITVVAESGAQATYTVRFDVAPNVDATLAGLQVVERMAAGEGVMRATSRGRSGLSIDYDPEVTDYTLTIDNGAELPMLVYEPRAGQNIIVTEPNADEQQVLVVAESGATKTYTIRYRRVPSSNAYLSDILIDGVSLEGFDAEQFDYVDTLAWRTRIVPCVFAVGERPNQTITTYFSAVNGTTKIHVVAEDGQSTNDYTIAFPVRKSSTVTLEDLYLSDSQYEFSYSPETTDYIVKIPYHPEALPNLLYTKKEEEQNITFISRPLGQKNELIVTAENGDQRTYTVLFEPTESDKSNRLASLTVRETGEALDVAKDSLTVALPYGTTTLNFDYTKSFDEQTVFVQPGSLYRPTVITVRSNRAGESDKVYTLTPALDTQNPAVLTGLSVLGQTLAFDKNQFSYVVNYTGDGHTPYVTYTKDDNVSVNVLANDTWHWSAEVSANVTWNGATTTYKNTYSIYYHYSAEVIPNADFTEWTTAQYNGATKPAGWTVPADITSGVSSFGVTNYTTDAVQKGSESVVFMKTWYGSSVGYNPLAATPRSIPSIMTIGDLAIRLVTWNDKKGTTGSFSGYIPFYNTPDAISVNYNFTSKSDENDDALFAYRFFDTAGNELNFDYVVSNTTSDYTTYTQALDLYGKNIKGMNVAVNATNQASNFNPGARLYIDWFRLSYNSALSALTVNGIAATKSGNAFTATLTDCESVAVPTLVFTGEVPDQAPKVEWSAEVVDGDYAVRTAAIANYAEDASNTDYTLTVRRPLDPRNTLSDLLIDGLRIDGFDAATTDYTVHLASTTHHLPCVEPVAISTLEQISLSYADSVLQIKVVAESGAENTYSVRFVTDLSDDTTLASLSDVADFAPETREYTYSGESLPSVITFAKQLDGQTVVCRQTQSECVLTVTAENGAEGTYKVALQKPVVATTGQLQSLELNGDVYAAFASDKYDYTLSRPESMSFERMAATDSVVFVQSAADMQWQVYGTEQHTYTLTYPTTLSDNTKLAGVTLNGEDYTDFNAALYSYTIATDTFVNIEVAKAEEAQHIALAYDSATTTYTLTVTAEDGTVGRPYSFRITPSLSADKTLRAIALNDTSLAQFDPATLMYVVTLPAAAAKTVEPQMPSVTYTAGHAGQHIELTPGKLGTTTDIVVTSEDGKQLNTYTLLVKAEPSHNADLTGIVVDGVPVARFEAGRHYYSARTTNEEATITWSSEDNFQTVTRTDVSSTEHVLHVVAQDGTTTQDYTVEVFVEKESNDATLANILLNGQSFVDFERALNPKLTYSPQQNTYSINLPSGTTILPEVAASLNADGQSVAISSSEQSIYLDVTAKDGVSTNRYSLEFVVPLSSNANLGMLYVDGDSIADFVSSYYFYQMALPVGQHSLPEVVGQKSESAQTVTTSLDPATNRASIEVLAEDGTTKATYVIAFSYTYSTADTLQMIYADGLPVADFASRGYYYSLSLPVGTTAFPELSWDVADEWQTVHEDTVEQSATRIVRQVVVTSESGRSNTYTIAHDILLSAIDTVQMIYIDDKPMTTFAGSTNEYWYTLPSSATAVPSVFAQAGDRYQTLSYSTEADASEGKMLGQKSIITVVAANGTQRTYTIHYPLSLSSETELSLIYVAGSPLSDFDAERMTYRVSLEMNATDIPMVTVAKKEDVQSVDIEISGDVVRIKVTAEDKSTATYTLTFVRKKSSNTALKDIQLGDGLSLDFEPSHYDYTVTLPYGHTTLPSVTAVRSESDQQVEVSEPLILATGEQIVTITVTAANEEDQAAYTLTFVFAKNNDASLTAIYVRNELLAGFHADSTEYTISYPAGSTTADFATASDVTYSLSSAEATCHVDATDDGTIMLNVTAEDGTIRTYIIRQTILLDEENRLSMIYLDDVEYEDFDADTEFYTYYIVAGLSAPKVTATAMSDLADVSIKEVAVGDTCIIICTSESGDSRRYYIYFAESEINDALTPTDHDVLIKRIPGSTQILVATTRKDVTFGLYDTAGRRIRMEKIATADPNDVQIVTEADGRERLLNVDNYRSGTIISLDPNTIYFYVFFVQEKKRFASGKLSIAQ